MHCICRKELTNDPVQSNLKRDHRENQLASLDIDLTHPVIGKCATKLWVNTSRISGQGERI